jgi:LysR family glycine cleavage system transcriptional activator
MIAQAAVAGLGVALLPVFMLEDELASGKLEIVSDQFLPTKTSYFLVVPETRASLPAVKMFTDWVIGQARTASEASTRDSKISTKKARSRSGGKVSARS